MKPALYEVPEFGGDDDYLPDLGLERIAGLIERLPRHGFDMTTCNATTKGVTATLRFDRSPDPIANLDQFEAMLHAVTVVRILHANLVAARKALSSDEAKP